MTIKHLILSGGGPIMIQNLSAIQELEKNKYLDLNEIESIYGTSAGAIVAVIIALKYDWETINDYIIKRSWHNVFPINVQNMLDSYTKKGLFDLSTIEKCFKPLFDAKNIPLNINLQEFYDLTHIELHFFTFDINSFQIEEIYHKTYPKISVMTALQMTCALPVMVTPVIIENKCFIDGGIACNYPLSFCINSGKNPDEMLGFKNKYGDKPNFITSDSTLVDFILNFLFKSVFYIHNNYEPPAITNEVICDASYMTIESLKDSFSKIEVRKSLFEEGKKTALKYLEKLQS
jgi:predicted acylesterase/phospholipase RssA